jgi:hypothetical protein
MRKSISQPRAAGNLDGIYSDLNIELGGEETADVEVKISVWALCHCCETEIYRCSKANTVATHNPPAGTGNKQERLVICWSIHLLLVVQDC